MKKILSLILAVAVIATTLVSTAFAAFSYNQGSNAQIDQAVAAVENAAKTNYAINDMTKEEYLYMVRKFVPEGLDIFVDLAPSGNFFICKNATAEKTGKVSATFTFYWKLKDAQTQRYDLQHTTEIVFKIPKLSSENVPTVVTPSFTDVAPNAWYAESVKWAVDKKITSGTSDTTFSPDALCTRAQIITFIFRASGSLGTKMQNPYTDVTESDYFYNPARWAAYKNIYRTNTGLFEGNTPCTRAEVVTYLWKYKNSPKVSKKASFTDVPADAEYADAVSWAVNKGITSGTSATTFSPNDTCTRAQIVTFLYRAFK